MEKKNKCDHMIGMCSVVYSGLPPNIRISYLRSTLEKFQKFDYERFEYGQLYRNVYVDLTKFIDNIGVYGLWFNFCPDCGQLIDWDEVKQELKKQILRGELDSTS